MQLKSKSREIDSYKKGNVIICQFQVKTTFEFFAHCFSNVFVAHKRNPSITKDAKALVQVPSKSNFLFRFF